MQGKMVYRHLLRSIGKHVGRDGSKKHFKDFVTDEFRQNSKLVEQGVVDHKLKLACDYAFLLNSVHHHQELLFSYNIAVDRTEEMRKTLKKSAASLYTIATVILVAQTIFYDYCTRWWENRSHPQHKLQVEEGEETLDLKLGDQTKTISTISDDTSTRCGSGAPHPEKRPVRSVSAAPPIGPPPLPSGVPPPSSCAPPPRAAIRRRRSE